MSKLLGPAAVGGVALAGTARYRSLVRAASALTWESGGVPAP